MLLIAIQISLTKKKDHDVSKIIFHDTPETYVAFASRLVEALIILYNFFQKLTSRLVRLITPPPH